MHFAMLKGLKDHRRQLKCKMTDFHGKEKILLYIQSSQKDSQGGGDLTLKVYNQEAIS